MQTWTRNKMRILCFSDFVFSQYQRGEADLKEWENVRTNTVSAISSSHSKAERECWKSVLTYSNSKELWERIDWKGSLTRTSATSSSPSADELAKHLQKKGDSMEAEYFVYPCVDKHVPELDNEITFEEISKATGNLKEGKSTYDGWTPSMISRVSDIIFPIIYLIFNTILMCRIFPSKWRTTLVAAIFKNKGTLSAAKNYRPISLVHMLAKLFDFILLDRFKKWFKRDDQQTAYQQGRCTADHIFLLRCLISWVKKSKSKLFIVCIDFDGAFDRISRHTLFKK